MLCVPSPASSSLVTPSAVWMLTSTLTSEPPQSIISTSTSLLSYVAIKLFTITIVPMWVAIIAIKLSNFVLNPHTIVWWSIYLLL